MKKFSAVLLVLALVGGALFASFTGNAAVSFGVDFDKKEYGFVNSTELKAEITILERIGSAKGETDIYAEINAELALAFVLDDVVLYDVSGVDLNATGLEGTAKITSAKIIGDNWYVGILGALGAPNFAKTAIELNADTGASLLNLRAAGMTAPGVEVGFAGYSFGLGIDGKYKEGEETYKVLVAARTPEYEIADGVTAKAGAAVFLNDGDFKGAVSLAGGFAKDDLDISLATDLLMDKTGVADLKFDAEVALAATYDFLTADVYFATKAMAADLQTAPPSYVDPNILSVKLGAVIEGFNITVKGLDLVNQQDLSASVSYAINDAFTVAVRGGYNIKNEEWKAGAGVEYTHDMFTASLDADLNGTDEVKGLELGATIKSTTLVDGAILSLGYANANILADKKGAITAKAVIEF
jgi:hypothetical protein